jgi:LemA protein
MEADERIGRMEREGLITPDQAEQLRASVRLKNHPGPVNSHTRRPWLPYFAALAAAAIITLLFVISGEPQLQQVQDVSQTLNLAEETGAMNKTLLNTIAIVLLLIVPFLILTAIYNGLVNREEAVLKSWAQVESQFQRRADLVPALIETVGAYVQHERKTLSEVTAGRRPELAALARAVDELVKKQDSLTGMLSGSEDLLTDQAQMDQLVGLQAALGKNLSGFIALAEDYPQLRASDQFLELQAQLEGTENRINVARLRFNEAVNDYNAAIRRLPGTLIAGFGNFQRKAYFQADEGAAQAPAIEID